MNTKQKLCLSAAVVFVALAGSLAIASGDIGFKASAALCAVVALFFASGIWSEGMPERERDEVEDDWYNAIK